MRDSMWVERERNQEGGERKRDLRWGRERYQEVGERDIRMVEREVCGSPAVIIRAGGLNTGSTLESMSLSGNRH